MNLAAIIGCMIMGLCFNTTGYYFKKTPIVVVATVLWLGIGAWSFSLVGSSYDVYTFLGFVCIMMGIVSVLESFMWVVTQKPDKMSSWEYEEGISQKHADELKKSMGRIKRKRRPY